MADDAVKRALKRHAQTVDQAVERFTADLDAVVAKAQASLQSTLLAKLKFDHQHRVLRTARNQQVLRKLPQLWQTALDAAGLDGAINRYLDTFPSQIPAFKDVLATVNQAAKTPLPMPDFTADDYSYFNGLRLATRADLADIITNAASAMAMRAAFSVGAIGFRALTQQIIEKTGASIARAKTIANTSLQGMYRAVAERGYDRIESGLGKTLLYDWIGPDDEKTSEKCEDLLAKSKKAPLSRTEVDNLKPYPGNPEPVRIYGFHYNCRHTFVVSLRQNIGATTP